MRAIRNVLFLGSALTLAACGGEMDMNDDGLGQSAAPLHQAAPGLRIDGSYIVKLKDGATARAVAALAGVSPRHEFSIINGFSVNLNEGQLNALRRLTDVVEYVEEDAVVQADATQTGATWGLDRIDQRALPLNGTYTYTTTASNVTAYIIDTGLQANHSQFGGRAANVYDAFGGTGADCQGHGTHVGGTVGGTTYGVAKGVKLRGVRVLDCSGSGSNTGVIAGMDWVRNNAVKPAVANMSLGGGASTAVNTAANNLANSGVFLAVAAGNNSGANACNYSPAGAAAATTVGSTASNDTRSSFSNIGSCVDIYAPGSSITSARLNGTSTTMSGTSMASPHVAGVGALYKGTYGDASSATVDSWIKTNATTLSFGKLLYKGSL
ncbi:S8 family peptidase [Archangium violaceum]|uniref:S8 family peptidase n=1 Tax=Archangium violaceum TaxID=83451 RepID=UPI00193B4E6C|nr:S8 family peptidase [Archangium violaceum]QRK09244.1 S8 family peptidase [Archangium violaceum]